MRVGVGVRVRAWVRVWVRVGVGALLAHLERDAVEHVLLLLRLQLVRRALGLLLLRHLIRVKC